MKCPMCWAEKAYLNQAKGWRKKVLPLLLLRPMKCNHCFHKFLVFWPLTIGKQVHPPPLRIAPGSHSAGPSQIRRSTRSTRTQSRRADAA